MIRPEDWSDMVLEKFSERVLRAVEEQPVRHVRETIIFRTILRDHKWNKGPSRIPDRSQRMFIRDAVRSLVERGKLLVVKRFPMRDSRELGPGKEELVVQLGCVLDELAVI